MYNNNPITLVKKSPPTKEEEIAHIMSQYTLLTNSQNITNPELQKPILLALLPCLLSCKDAVLDVSEEIIESLYDFLTPDLQFLVLKKLIKYIPEFNFQPAILIEIIIRKAVEDNNIYLINHPKLIFLYCYILKNLDLDIDLSVMEWNMEEEDEDEVSILSFAALVRTLTISLLVRLENISKDNEKQHMHDKTFNILKHLYLIPIQLALRIETGNEITTYAYNLMGSFKTLIKDSEFKVSKSVFEEVLSDLNPKQLDIFDTHPYSVMESFLIQTIESLIRHCGIELHSIPIEEGGDLRLWAPTDSVSINNINKLIRLFLEQLKYIWRIDETNNYFDTLISIILSIIIVTCR